MDDVEVTLLRHVAGDFAFGLGQLCTRCGLVLDEGNTPGVEGFPPGEAVMASVPTGTMRILESAMRADRDRSDEADCPSIVDAEACTCGHRPEVHRYPDVPGGAGCWSCDCLAFSTEGPDA